MSIVMSVRVGDGLVMAADSAATLQALDQQRRVRGVAKIFNNATKILQLRDYPVGVASWGAGTIGARSISSLVYEHANERLPLKQIQKVDNKKSSRRKRGLSVKQEATTLMNFLFKFYESQYPDWKKQSEEERPSVGVLMGGYSGKEFFPHEFVFNIPGKEFQELRKPRPGGGQDFGANWYGAADALVRFHHGRDDRVKEILTRNKVKADTINVIMETIKREIQYPVPFGGMPLQDAVDYALFMTGLAIGRYRFSAGPEICGGPIDVAAITRQNGFKWIQRKSVSEPD